MLVVTTIIVKTELQLLSDKAKPQTKQSDDAVGYDLSSAQDDVIPAGSRKLIQTNLAMTVPSGTYGRITPRSGLALKHHIDIGAGVIDRDYHWGQGVVYQPSTLQGHCKEMDNVLGMC